MTEPQRLKKGVPWFLLALMMLGASHLADHIPFNSPTHCPNAVMAIVAHEDDDLLFMNPDIASALHAGRCVRTVYLTAGDEGQGRAYWHSREKGVEAAYASMADSTNAWIEHSTELAPNEFAQTASLKDNDRATLVFMRLPDGNTKGQGFSATRHASLAKLLSSRIPTISTVDGRSVYTVGQLQAVLENLMAQYAPTEVYAQAIDTRRFSQDHSDHTATGKITSAAYTNYLYSQKDDSKKKALSYYLGYSAAHKPTNLAPNDAIAKERIFLAYARNDHQACPAIFVCTNYSAYFTRQDRIDSSAPNHPGSHNRSPFVGL